MDKYQLLKEIDEYKQRNFRIFKPTVQHRGYQILIKPYSNELVISYMRNPFDSRSTPLSISLFGSFDCGYQAEEILNVFGDRIKNIILREYGFE